MNGTCFAADGVVVNITGPAAYNNTFAATVKGGLWEFMWNVAPGGSQLASGAYSITVTPYAGTHAGTAGPAKGVTLTNNLTLPVASLSILPSSIISGFLFGSDAFGGITAGENNITMSVQARSTVSTAGTALKTLTLSEPGISAAKTLTPDLVNINNDDAATGTPATYILNSIKGIQEGLSTITLTAVDNKGTSVDYKRHILVDLTEPTVDAVSRTYIDANDIVLSGSVSDPGELPSGIAQVLVTIQPPSGAANTVVLTANLTYGTSPGGSVGWTAIYPFTENGTYSVTTTATDNAGNVKSLTTSIPINTESLTVAITTPNSGQANFPFVSGTIPVTGAISGSTGTVTWQLQDNGTEISHGTGTAPNFTWVTTNAANAVHTLTLAASDSSGKTGSTSITVTVDDLGSVPVISSPTTNTYLTGTVKIIGTISDSDPAAWVLNANGTQIGSGSGSSATVSWTPATDGDYTLILSATNKAGLSQSSAPVTVHIDNLSATLPTISSPTTGTYVTGTIKVTGAITDKYAGDVTWVLTANGAQIGKGGGATASVSWTPSPDADYSLVLTETNKAGLSQSSNVPVVVHVDNLVSPPAITSPLNNTVYSVFPGSSINVVVAGTINDPYPNTWSLTANGTTIGSGTGTSVSVTSWNPTVGTFRLTLTGTNKAGLQYKPSSITITIQNQPVASLTLSNVVDENGLLYNGIVASSNSTIIPDTNPGTQFYSRGAFTLAGSVVGRYTSVSLTDSGTPISAALPPPLPASATTTGSHKFQLIVSSVGTTQGTSSLRVIVDKTAPVITLYSPYPNATTSALPGSTLVVIFKVAGKGTTGAPLALEGGAVPKLTLSISSGDKYDLFAAAQGLSTNVPKDTASVSGDKFNGYNITWNIPLDTTKYLVGDTYTLTLGGAVDVVGNQSNSVSAMIKIGL
jgi:hypothetical protein